MRFFHHFALEVDEESITDELERGKVYPIRFAHIFKEVYFPHYNVEGAAWCFLLFFDFDDRKTDKD